MQVSLKGEFCIGSASVLSLISLFLLLFVHIGTINTSNVPRGIYMAKVNTSGYSQALSEVLRVPVPGLYTNNASAPLGEGQGLRELYKFGLYTQCGYVNETAGTCSKHITGQPFKPARALLADSPTNYSRILDAPGVLPENDFRNEKYTGQSTKAAYWMILLGTVCAALAFLTGFLKNNWSFLVSTIFAIAGSFVLLIGASIWTVVVSKVQVVNNVNLVNNSTRELFPLGITASSGPGIPLLWGGFVALLLSVIPYMISCCTWKG